MPGASTEADDALAVGVAAALIGSTTRQLNRWSIALALASVLMLGVRATTFWPVLTLSASLIAGLVHAYFAARAEFDAALFAFLGGRQERYAALDALLASWGLRSETSDHRAISQRIDGARRLLRRQGWGFFAQVILFAAGLILILTNF